MGKLISVSCTRCLDIIEVPHDLALVTETLWCKCGKTYLQRGPGFTNWGGPGRPKEQEGRAARSAHNHVGFELGGEA